jgi:hypothetical protein
VPPEVDAFGGFLLFWEGSLSSFVLIAIILIVVGLIAAILKKLKTTHPADSLIFESCGELFTPAERSFYGVLQQALGSGYVVFGKVRLGDVVQPVKGLGRSLHQTALNKINRKHLDFVICRADDLALVAAIELDDKSHQRKDRGERDNFVDQALESAGIAVGFSAKKGYELGEVKARLSELLNVGNGSVEVTTVAVPHIQNIATATDIDDQKVDSVVNKESPVCPACQSAMVKRQAKKGPNTGQWFWACSTFPKCRKVVAIGN